MDNRSFFRGQIYYVDLKDFFGSVQTGCRPAVIVSNNVGNKYSATVMVAPITSREKRNLPTHVDIESGRIFGTILCEQIQTVDKSNIKTYCGALTPYQTKQLSAALMSAFNLDGVTGSSIAPESVKVVDDQIERCWALEEQFAQEIERLERLTGYCAEKGFEVHSPESSGVSDSKPFVPPVEKKRCYNKRSPQEIKDFISEWECKDNNRKEVAAAYGFSNTTTAGTFYKRHKGE